MLPPLPPKSTHPRSTTSAPMAPLLLLLLPLLAVAAAQTSQPPPPPRINTSASDAAALHAVFRRWGLEEDGSAAAEDPCGKRVWFESPARNASINCSCPGSVNECRITHLNVTGYPNITDIPRDLFSLTELVSVDLSNNNLNGVIPSEVGNLSKLETWHFNSNQLGGFFPNESSNLKNLQSLWMFDNNIEGRLPEFIAKFTNLTDLRMYGMKLQGPIPTNFSNLINLKILMLGDLDGGNSYFNFTADWQNLSTLSLRNCGISGELPSTAPQLPNLKYLDLSSNRLSGEIQRLPYKSRSYIYVGRNNFSGRLPSEIIQSSFALDVSYNPLLTISLPNAGPVCPINYIGTLFDASTKNNSENATLLNCLHIKECDRKYYPNPITSFAVNCGGKQKNYSDTLPTTFDGDLIDLGPTGFHVNTESQWVVSHVGSVGSDRFNFYHGIINTSQPILGTDMSELYQTARTSTSDLWYYVVGLANGRYKVQLFFAEIVIDSQFTAGQGRRLFNIDIQDRNFKRDFDITKEAGGSRKPINITDEMIVDNSMLKIHLYWNGRGTCCIPREGVYGPLVSAIRVFRIEDSHYSPTVPLAPHSAQRDIRQRGVVAGIAALCIAAAVISSSVVYLWWKWVSLVKHPKA